MQGADGLFARNTSHSAGGGSPYLLPGWGALPVAFDPGIASLVAGPQQRGCLPARASCQRLAGGVRSTRFAGTRMGSLPGFTILSDSAGDRPVLFFHADSSRQSV